MTDTSKLPDGLIRTLNTKSVRTILLHRLRDTVETTVFDSRIEMYHWILHAPGLFDIDQCAIVVHFMTFMSGERLDRFRLCESNSKFGLERV